MPEPDDQAFSDKHREAALAWPHFHVSEATFRAAIERAVLSTGAAFPVDRLHTVDLYLVSGCLAGDAIALGIMEREVVGAVKPAVERACRDKGGADDALQSALTKLLVGPPEPKLLQYTGRGPLVGWVRVIAVREALMAQRKTKKEVLSDRFLAVERIEGVEGMELEMLRDLHGRAFEDAVRDAMHRLDTEQRALLRFHFRDGLSIDQIAPMLGVHRATVARRLERARGDVLVHTTAILRERQGLSESEARSLCLALASEIDLSLARAFPDEAMP